MGIETALLIGAVATAASAGASVIGGIQQRNTAKKQAGIAQMQAEEQAQQELKSANTAAKIQKMQFIKGGVGALTGSPLLVMEETYDQGNKNAATARRNGQAQADLLRKQGSAAFTQGLMGGFKSVGSGVLKGYDMGVLGTKASINPNDIKWDDAAGTTDTYGSLA